MRVYYTTTETAQALNTTYRTISRWLKLGIIEGTKQGGSWQISAAEVERMQKAKGK